MPRPCQIFETEHVLKNSREDSGGVHQALCCAAKSNEGIIRIGQRSLHVLLHLRLTSSAWILQGVGGLCYSLQSLIQSLRPSPQTDDAKQTGGPADEAAMLQPSAYAPVICPPCSHDKRTTVVQPQRKKVLLAFGSMFSVFAVSASSPAKAELCRSPRPHRPTVYSPAPCPGVGPGGRRSMLSCADDWG